jgi:hypothetical protein
VLFLEATSATFSVPLHGSAMDTEKCEASWRLGPQTCNCRRSTELKIFVVDVCVGGITTINEQNVRWNKWYFRPEKNLAQLKNRLQSIVSNFCVPTDYSHNILSLTLTLMKSQLVAANRFYKFYDCTARHCDLQ